MSIILTFVTDAHRIFRPIRPYKCSEAFYNKQGIFGGELAAYVRNNSSSNVKKNNDFGDIFHENNASG
jgi:hypothetical protein